MGVDACVFDSRSRESYYFDRAYNVLDAVDGEAGLLGTPERLYGEGVWKKPVVDAKEFLHYLDVLIADRERTGFNAKNLAWTRAVRAFVAARPKGRFFIATDSDAMCDMPMFSELTGYTKIAEETYYK